MKDGIHPTGYVKLEYKKQTNGDRIRAMSDDELADFLCRVNNYSDLTLPSNQEISVMLEWLQSEVEE